uniref:hypothetical protein n=1 Tax=Actinokineospora sp. CA-119265 TaxID=3239890 RepID=UPI003F494697
MTVSGTKQPDETNGKNARAAFLSAARRQMLDADTFAEQMITLFRGTDREKAAKKLADAVAGSAVDAVIPSRKPGDTTAAEHERRVARQRAEQFVQQWLAKQSPDRA